MQPLVAEPPARSIGSSICSILSCAWALLPYALLSALSSRALLEQLVAIQLAPFFIGSTLYWIYALAAFIPNLAVSVRRLHDTGRSGFNLFWMFLPIIGTILLLVYFVTGSNPGDNAYGPEPEK